MVDTRNAVEELLGLEAERCRAISEQDWEALGRLLAHDLTHTHMNGLVQDRGTYLEHVQRRPRRTARGDLTVRIYGDTAVMNGRMINHPDGGGAPAEGEVIQVWVRRDERWQLVAFQASRLAQAGG